VRASVPKLPAWPVVPLTVSEPAPLTTPASVVTPVDAPRLSVVLNRIVVVPFTVRLLLPRMAVVMLAPEKLPKMTLPLAPGSPIETPTW